MESEAYTNELGTTEWRDRAGERHRVDGPAVEYSDGSEEWYQRGVLHRVGGPAVYAPTEGFAAWYQQGQLHREDGPARTWAYERDGKPEYWLRGQQLSREQWQQQLTPEDRAPYVGRGADGAQRSAWIDRAQADPLHLDDPRHGELIDSALRWEQQAERAAQADGEKAPPSQWNATERDVRPTQSERSPWDLRGRATDRTRQNRSEPPDRGIGLERA